MYPLCVKSHHVISLYIILFSERCCSDSQMEVFVSTYMRHAPQPRKKILGWSISVCLFYHIGNLCMSSGSHILSSKLFSKATDKNFKNIQRIRPLGHHPIDINISGKDNYPLVMTNSLTWYRWPIEIYGLPSYKMGGSFHGYVK